MIEMTFAQREAAAALRAADKRRQEALLNMRREGELHIDDGSMGVVAFLVADSIYEEKKAAAIRAFAPLMP